MQFWVVFRVCLLKNDTIRSWYIFKEESEGIPEVRADETIRGVLLEGTCTMANEDSFKIKFNKGPKNIIETWLRDNPACYKV